MDQAPSQQRLYRWLVPLAGFLAFIPTFWYGFVWDDRFTIVQNTAQLSSWKVFRQIWVGPYDTTVSMFRPITSAFAFIEFQAFHLHPFGYHLTSTLLHAIACVLVYQVARQLTSDDRAGLAAGLLFALHPIHIEAIAWVSAFAEPLVGILILAGLLSYIRYRRDNHPAWLAIVCVWLFLGLLVKENAVVLPFLILTYEFTLADRATRTGRVLLSAFLSITATVVIYAAIRFHVFTHVAPVETPMPFSTMFFTWPSAIIFYLQKLLVPFPTSGFYEQTYVTAANLQFWTPAALLLLIAVAVTSFSRRSSNPGLIRFCWIAMPMALIPFLDLNVFQWREISHDRFLYLPSVFFCIFLAQLFVLDLRIVRPLYARIAALIVIAYGALLVAQLPPWHDDVAFYAHARSISPNNARPAWGLAQTYLIQGNVPAAERVLTQLVQRVPAPMAFEQLAQLRMQLGNPAAAEEPLRRAIAAAPAPISTRSWANASKPKASSRKPKPNSPRKSRSASPKTPRTEPFSLESKGQLPHLIH
jgi:hypothetical protein